MNPIEINDLHFAYGKRPILRAVNLTVEPGSFYALLGANGAGKSTLLNLCAGMLRPKRGLIRILNRETFGSQGLDWTHIGYVSEGQRLYDWLTGEELVAFVRPLYPDWDTDFCTKLLERLNLPLGQKITSYSKGERMKLRLLLAMAFRPRVLLLDEPFSGLDPTSQEQLIACLIEATDQQGLSVLFASHDLSEVERLGDTIGYLFGAGLKINESLESLQSRFRRVRVYSPQATPMSDPSVLQVTTTENGFTFVETEFCSNRERVLRERFGDNLDIAPLTLRDIALALACPSSTGTIG